MAREKDREVEEEQREQEKLIKRLRDKEIQYNERLRKWESREKSKASEYKREKEKEKVRKSEMQKEAMRLFEFLQEYDDERDDTKYYKVSERSLDYF